MGFWLGQVGCRERRRRSRREEKNSTERFKENPIRARRILVSSKLASRSFSSFVTESLSLSLSLSICFVRNVSCHENIKIWPITCCKYGVSHGQLFQPSFYRTGVLNTLAFRNWWIDHQKFVIIPVSTLDSLSVREFFFLHALVHLSAAFCVFVRAPACLIIAFNQRDNYKSEREKACEYTQTHTHTLTRLCGECASALHAFGMNLRFYVGPGIIDGRCTRSFSSI